MLSNKAWSKRLNARNHVSGSVFSRPWDGHWLRRSQASQMRSTGQWSQFCNSHYVSQFAAVFIDPRAKWSAAQCFNSLAILSEAHWCRIKTVDVVHSTGWLLCLLACLLPSWWLASSINQRLIWWRFLCGLTTPDHSSYSYPLFLSLH